MEASVRCDAKVGNAVQLDSHVRYAGIYSPFAGVMFCRLTLVTGEAWEYMYTTAKAYVALLLRVLSGFAQTFELVVGLRLVVSKIAVR